MTITFNDRPAELIPTSLVHIAYNMKIGRATYTVIRNVKNPDFYIVADRSMRVQGYLGVVNGELKQVTRLS